MHVAQNLRYAFRLFLKSPGFTVAVLLMLGLGIGANTAIFSILNAVLLEPLPYQNPNALVLVSSMDPRTQSSGVEGCLSFPRFTLLEERNRVFAGLAAFASETFNLTGLGQAEQLHAARVSWNFFDVLGVKPAMGRAFLESEGSANGPPAVVISERLWSRLLQRRRDLLGQPLSLDSRAYLVVGVLPQTFQFGLVGTAVDVWVPRIDELNLVTPQQVRGGVCYLNGVARIRSGLSPSMAQAQMDVLNRDYQQANPKLPDSHPDNVIQLSRLDEALVGGYRATLVVLFAAVGLVLLIACANVANLLLARAVGRSREIAIRTALGASRRDLFGQLLTESMLLSVMGGLLGLAIGVFSSQLLSTLAARKLPRANEIDFGLHPRVLLFTLGLAVATGILFGLAPALQLIKVSLVSSLREGGRGNTGGRGGNLYRNALIAGQIALSVILLVAAGLLIRTFLQLEMVHSGVDAGHVITMNLALPRARYATAPQMVNFYDSLLKKIEAVPGIESAAASSALPVNPIRFSPVLPEGQPQAPLQERPVVEIQTFTRGYLRTLGIPLIRGRAFTEHDTADSAPVAIVNQTFARRFFPGQEAVGKHVLLGRRTTPNEIVGVIGDVKNVALAGQPELELDLPFSQLAWATMNVEVRAAGDPHALINPIRAAIASLDPDQPVTAVRTMDEVLDEARSEPRLLMMLLGVFAGSAFVLALIGLYGLVNYSVKQRSQELGVRMALGATGREIVMLVLRQGLRLSLAGICAGIAISLIATKLLASLLFGVPPRDPLTFLVSPVLFLIAALAASALPAMRAARVDPSEALRHE